MNAHRRTFLTTAVAGLASAGQQTLPAKDLPARKSRDVIDTGWNRKSWMCFLTLTGLVSERTAMEAMIVHSDNAGTDMVLKEAGPRKVRNFIASIGLKSTQIPDSTRSFAGYLVGASNYKTITWDELTSIPPGPLDHPFLNDVETLASSPDDLVSFFSRALQGKFFVNRDTRVQFRRILSLGNITYLVPFSVAERVWKSRLR